VRSYQILLLSSTKATTLNQTPQPIFGPPVNRRTLRKDPTNLKVRRTHYLEEHPLNKTNQNFLPLFMQNETLQNRHNPINPFQLFVFKDYQSPGTFDIKPNPVGPIMTSIPMAQTQIVADKAKEYGMNKPTPFTGDQTKIRQFLQDCLGYLDMNQSIYNTD
jgi:hypothetical protein